MSGRATHTEPRERLISADSHVLEPPHLWTTYMERKFHDKVPRVVPDGEGGEAWQFAPDVPPAPIGIYASAGRSHDQICWTGVTFAQANPGNFRGGPRLEEQDADAARRAGSGAAPRRRPVTSRRRRAGIRLSSGSLHSAPLEPLDPNHRFSTIRRRLMQARQGAARKGHRACQDEQRIPSRGSG